MHVGLPPGRQCSATFSNAKPHAASIFSAYCSQIVQATQALLFNFRGRDEERDFDRDWRRRHLVRFRGRAMAQVSDPGRPRDAQGRVIMNAPPPKTADGKPDLSGNWVRGDRDPLPSELAGIVGNREGQGGRGGRGSLPPGIAVEPPTAPFPPDPNSPPLATFFELGANIPGGLPYTPWAADLKKQRLATDDKDNPDANCMPMGFTQFHMQPQPRKIIQTPNLIVILYEANYGLRYIYTDGRKLPPQGEPQPWWYGYSVGRWEGDTLVVDSNNLRGAEETEFDGWLDVRGSPYSGQAKFTERFRRPSSASSKST